MGFVVIVCVGQIDFGNAHFIFHFLELKGKLFKRLGTNDGWCNDASLGQRVVFRDLQDCLCLVVEFRTDMPSRVVVSFVEVKHGLNVNILFTRSLHQVAHQLGSLR